MQTLLFHFLIISARMSMWSLLLEEQHNLITNQMDNTLLIKHFNENVFT